MKNSGLKNKEGKEEMEEAENEITMFDLSSTMYELPILKLKRNIQYAIENNNCTIIVGETGSGKTTKIPEFLIEGGWCKNNMKIALTLPRRISVVNIATRIAANLGVPLGGLVGYSISLKGVYDPMITRVKIMTDGMLVREMLLDPLLEKYSVIMIDDLHERSMYSDILLGLIKKIWKKRPKLRLILSSATLSAESYRMFMSENPENPSKPYPTTIIPIEGRMFPVDIFYSVFPCKDYVTQAIQTVCQLHKEEEITGGDCLVFLTGYDEITKFIALFNQLKEQRGIFGSKTKDSIFCLPLFAGLSIEKQMEAFKDTPINKRKVIASTNVAETSITINNIGYVIDSGFVKMKFYNPITDMENLAIVPTSQMSADQRAGRSGRLKRKCFRLYPCSMYDKLPERSPPEVQRRSACGLLLQLKALGIGSLSNFSLLSPPSHLSLARGMERLYALGGIDINGELTRDIGYKLVELPLDPRLGTILLNSNKEEYKCQKEILGIVAMLSIEGNIFTLKDPSQIAKKKKSEYLGAVEGDHISLLNIFNKYEGLSSPSSKLSFCRQLSLNSKCMEQAVKIYMQLKAYTLQLGIIPILNDDYDDPQSILKCLLTAYFGNVAQRTTDGSYRSIRGKEVLWIHPSSVLAGIRPKWILYHELVVTSLNYMREVSKIEEEWLVEVAPHFFQDKKKENIEQKHKQMITIKEGETHKLGKKRMTKGFKRPWNMAFSTKFDSQPSHSKNKREEMERKPVEEENIHFDGQAFGDPPKTEAISNTNPVRTNVVFGSMAEKKERKKEKKLDTSLLSFCDDAEI